MARKELLTAVAVLAQIPIGSSSGLRRWHSTSSTQPTRAAILC